ncbi:hypothetical protein NUW54_g6792 [Trametes sanguinea]|uniref:Uncharacterized protein n=1 Tax=Trametes sanguinea TaxID=158606 RepID=A0ACC1PRB9_9APHY|nr:hypothetical protein NUW54_g6792 [Trametes sanguinea]
MQNDQVFRGFGTQRDMETCEALATEVRNLREVIKDNQTRSDAIRERFSTFRDDVSLFKVEFERTLQSAASKSKEAFNQCAEATLAYFTALGEKLKKFDEEMKATDVAFSACFAQCLLLKRFPGMKTKARVPAEAEAAKRNKPLKKLEQNQVGLTELENSLRALNGVLDEFAKNANTVEGAWELITHQFCELDALLEVAVSDIKAKARVSAEAEASKRNKALKNLEQEHVRLTELESSRRVMVRVLDDFANNANTVGDAWELISHQFCELDAQLGVAVTGTITPFFGTKLDSTFEAYEELKDILYGYASALGGRSLPR